MRPKAALKRQTWPPEGQAGEAKGGQREANERPREAKDINTRFVSIFWSKMAALGRGSEGERETK